MKRVTGCLVGLFLLWGTSVWGGDNKDRVLDQKRELDNIESSMKRGRQRLDSLQREQTRVQSEIGDFDQKISSDRKVINRLSGQLNQLQTAISRSDSQLVAHQELYERRRRRYLGNVRKLYFVTKEVPRAFSSQPNEELELNRRIVYLSALAGYESAGVAAASTLLENSVGELDDLAGRKKMVTGLKKKRETSYALGRSQKRRQQKNLDQLQRKSMAEADRVIMLQQAAEEMAALIARLEEQRSRELAARTKIAGPSVFAGLKGQLASPYRGKIVLTFGEHTDPVTRLKSFSPGITINGKAGRAVYSVASGTVAYAGNLRGYGNFVIINHDHQYYTTYAGLREILVAKDQFVPGRAKLGTAGKDGRVKFELRRGREPLDPVKWIKIETL